MVDKIIDSPLVDESSGMPEMDTCTSIPLPALEIPAESSDVQPVQVSQDIVDRSTRMRCASMPNIRVRFWIAGVNLHSGHSQPGTGYL